MNDVSFFEFEGRVSSLGIKRAGKEKMAKRWRSDTRPCAVKKHSFNEKTTRSRRMPHKTSNHDEKESTLRVLDAGAGSAVVNSRYPRL